MTYFDSEMAREGLYFIPLGGSEEFGVNLNVYACHGQILAVDCGIGFADERYPGIDILLPDPAFLEANLDDLQGLVITHAHEDHIGAVAYLWERLRCPLYASPFTAAVLREKLKERNLGQVPVHVVKPGDEVEIGLFGVQFLPVAHSIPVACALAINTPEGRVVHSGDWNLDRAPVIGATTDEKLFKKIGDEGVLAYIGDSTNSPVLGFAGSESDVAAGLIEEFKSCKGRIVVTMFSSNIGRVQSVARAAQACGRDVAVVGRSLKRMIGIAKECGYLNDIAEFISEDDLGYLPEERTVMMVTGSQGEGRAALSKIARGDFRGVKLSPGDTVIFSARAIPGNERAIYNVQNNLIAGGVRVVTPKSTKNIIHVSGHPCAEEVQTMYGWLRPDIIVPVHGERAQLEAQGALARNEDGAQVVVPQNGSVVRLSPGPAEVIDHVPTGIFAVDQKRVIPADHQSISARRKLQYSGAIHLALVLDARGALLGDIKLSTVGLIDEADQLELEHEEKIREEVLEILEDLTWEERLDDHFITEEMRIGLRRYAHHVFGVKPKTTVHVIRL